MSAGQSSQKQYGLIKTAKKAQPGTLKPSIFTNGSSSDEETAPAEDWGKAALKAISHGSVQAAQTRKVIRQAMQEDASLFQYDEVYDDMQQQKQNKVETKQTEDKKPRYMKKLLEAAGQRRHQQERRMERQVQHEREQEGDEFADKEQFVTEAYRQRLLERQKEEEQERRMKHIEELTDVTKQKDLGSFYRHMYQKTNARTEPEPEPEPEVKAEPAETADSPVEAEAAPAAAVKSEPISPGPEPTPAPAGRQYRPRRVSSPEAAPTAPDRHGEHRHRHRSRSGSGERPRRRRHRDRSRSADRGKAAGRRRSDERRERSRSGDGDRHRRRGGAGRSQRSRSGSGDRRRSGDRSDSAEGAGRPESRAPDSAEGKKSAAAPVKPRATSAEREARRRALYDKRTVGDVFEAARERYLERQAARLNGPCLVPSEA